MQALAAEREAAKDDRNASRAEKRRAEADLRYKMRTEKCKQKHRGH